jgi:hypothetical protein
MDDLDECICGHRLAEHVRRRECPRECAAEGCECFQYSLEEEDR